jgi:GntR family carbon starvation induced transcriptional regulator
MTTYQPGALMDQLVFTERLSLAQPSASLTTIAVNRLRDEIVRGQFEPGEKLRVKSLCERFDTNTSAMREALSRLVSEGWVRAEDQRGFYVAAISSAELIDLTRTRIQLESLALRQAVQLADVSWEGKLLATFHQLSKVPLPDACATSEQKQPWFNAHRTFHEALIEGCGSPTLIGLCHGLYIKSERYRNLSGLSKPQTGSRDLNREHQRILDAALARDATALVDEITQHFSKTTELVLDDPAAIQESGATLRSTA